MLAIGNYEWLIVVILGFATIIPVISVFGKIFTRDGRDSLAAHPIMILYFIIFFTYAYYFWYSPLLIEDYIGIGEIYRKLVYGALCFVPFMEKEVSS